MMLKLKDDVFEVQVDRIEVTSLHRPDTSWLHVDKAGHQHRWFSEGQPATSYNPTANYSAPSLIWIKDYDTVWEDGEPREVGHNECRECGEHIEPAYTADSHRMYTPGLRHCYINGQSVSLEEFERRFKSSL